MSQPQVRGAQLNSNDFRTIVSVGLGATLTISSLVEGQSLVYSGSPLGWRNATAAGGAGSVTAGDGLDSTAGSGSPFTGVFSVDATVARTNIATETFSFAGALSLNLTDTTQAADEDVWRISNSGGQFLISTRTDADGAGNNAIVIDRTGTTVDSITTGAPLISTASGVGTNSAIQLNSNIPALVFNDTDATASEGIWDITSTSASSALEFRTRTDAHGTGATWLQVVRSGTAVTSINFTGTAMTLNGISIHVGSPQPSGGGVGDALLAGSPITIINANSFALDQTLRIYDPGQTDYTDIYHDGSSLNFDSTNTAGVAFTFGGQSDFTIGSSSITLLRGNAFNMYNSTNNSLVQFAFDDSPTVHFRVVDFLGNVNYTVIEGMSLRIGTDDAAIGSPEGSYIETGLVGTEIQTVLNKVDGWRVKPSRTGPVWITRSFGSPQFGDINTSTTNPTMRIGFGSPTTTNREATLAIFDNYGPGLVLRDTNTDGELSWNVQTNNAFISRSANFTTWTIEDTSDNQTVLMSVLHSDPIIQFQGAPLGDIKINPRTNNSVASSDTGWGSYTTTDSAFFVEPNAANINIGGMSSGKNDGQWFIVVNAAAGPGSPGNTNTITFEHEEGTATATDRFLLPNKQDVVLQPNDSIQLIYDSTVSRWRCMSIARAASSGSGLGSPIGNPLELAPSKTSGASLRIPAGTAPSAPISGDLYATTQGLFFVGHGSPGNITHDLSHPVVSTVNSAVLNANNTITVATIPGMSIHFVSPAANYICEIHIRGRQTVPEAGIRIQLDTSGFGGQIEWTMIEYNDNPTYGPITTTAGGSPITYPSGDTSSDDAQIRGVDFKEQGNVTTAQALFATYQNGTGEFILTGYGYLTTGGGSVSASVLGAQSNATVGNTSFGYTIAGKAWMKLTRVTH